MKTNSITALCAGALVGASLLTMSGAAVAQNRVAAPVKTSKGDTWQMNCADARRMVHGPGGTLLNSGPDHYDLYHVGGGTCHSLSEDTQAAYVRTKDTPSCFVGYICVPPQNEVPN